MEVAASASTPARVITSPVLWRRCHGAGWVVDLTCLTGQYGLMAGVMNAFEAGPPPGGEQLPL